MRQTARTIDLPANPSDAALAEALKALLHEDICLRLHESLQLRHAAGTLHCEVIDEASNAHRCAFEYDVMVENARHAFEASRIAQQLAGSTRRWRVLVREGTRLVTVWPVPAAE